MSKEIAAGASLVALAILYKRTMEAHSRPLEIKNVYISEPVVREFYQNQKTAGLSNWSNRPLDNVIVSNRSTENISTTIEQIQRDYRDTGYGSANFMLVAPQDGGYILPQLTGSLNIQWIDPTSYVGPQYVQPVTNQNQFGATPINWQ
jgi:hypothetical protein